MRDSIGSPQTGSSGLGTAHVSGRSRVPNPAANTMAFLTLIPVENYTTSARR
jgi:hypothetical protein